MRREGRNKGAAGKEEDLRFMDAVKDDSVGVTE